ncbi:hypothetical protein QEH52_06760 [Coraliomargarita sp. SDUM461003]|uniref:Seryl-tRNA synthetase n=1 Tax=Thalassobacterium maritimum TaxID=3041265 RepID=A0ABU1ASY4_9BACT|nr:hypothetical protein [Coraliomargarita sp. SDUM461003]MBT62993.1 hypothetical protein [Puniceicoccaceae bacterium]MDQ8207201.1 hypothetical protein [Coraliomargarita sp. SDUM461003]HBR93775.1 hypothetical protein [Opitutae bacterium]|tara:strand:+ start:4070 stop:4342 length:273 start_codon:yes stop_codon:yes gene_type:complete
MLRYIYRWRYRRAQKAGSFKVPLDRNGYSNGRVNLGSYMSQPSVRGRTFDRFDLPRKRRKGLAILIVILLACLFGWIVYESIAAFTILKN